MIYSGTLCDQIQSCCFIIVMPPIFNIIIAPGQENVLLNAVQSEADVVETDSAPKCIVDAYKHAAISRTQTQILSLVVNNFTKPELQKMMPGVTIARIDAARKHAMVTGPGNIINAPMIYRMKLT